MHNRRSLREVKMARRKKPKIDGKMVEERLDTLKGELPLDEMEGIDLVFATDLLREYAGLVEMALACRESIESDGILIETRSGAKDNVKVKQVENPAFGTYYKVTSRMGDLATRTSKFMKQSVRQIQAEDETYDELADY
jgi:hypothetical protein